MVNLPEVAFRQKLALHKTRKFMKKLSCIDIMVFSGGMLIATNAHTMDQKNCSINEALKRFDFNKSEERAGFLTILRLTGGFLPPKKLDPNNPLYEKQKSFAELLQKSNIQDLEKEIYSAKPDELETIAGKINFLSLAEAKSFIFVGPECLWFRENYKKETTDRPELVWSRWIKENPANEKDFIEPLKALGLISEIKRPDNFIPDIIIWIGAIESSAEPRIYGDIPDDFSGEVIVFSNRRGLILNNKIFEPYGAINIAEQLNIVDNPKAIKIIEETCKGYTKNYVLATSELKESTQELRILIVDALFKKGFLATTAIDFNWPTEKELYAYLFKKAQQKTPKKLGKAKLTFDDPEPLPNKRLYDTTSEAVYWLNNQLKNQTIGDVHGKEKLKILALSEQPNVAYQHQCLENVLGKYYKVVTVGPKNEGFAVSDALQGLAKILYFKANQDPEIKTILNWLK